MKADSCRGGCSIAWIATIACVVFWTISIATPSGASPRSTDVEKISTREAQAHAGDQAKQRAELSSTQQELSAAETSYERDRKPQHRENETDAHGGRDWFDFADLGLKLLSATFTGALCAFAYRQMALFGESVQSAGSGAEAAAESARAARQAADAVIRTERARLVVQASNRGSALGAPEKSWLINCRVVNFGRTIGIVNQISGAVRYVPASEAPSLAGIRPLELPNNVVTAGDEVTTLDFPYRFENEWQRRTLAVDGPQDMQLLLCGEFTFTDIFDHRETQAFFLRYAGDGIGFVNAFDLKPV